MTNKQRKKRGVTIAICTLFWLSMYSQSYPTDYFILPVDHAFRCSGSFGELRNNHFHMGVDIKSSKGVSGDKIAAAADGYISRISINGGGYGNVLYIDHPNGYRTVYAHLSRFIQPVAEYIRANQYKNQKYETNIYPEPTKFQIVQGETIGFMGNSGRSFGPHLHFEIRESATDIPINPMLFGIKPKDDRDPILKNLKVIEWDSSGTISKTSFYPIRKVEDKYALESDTIFCQSDSVRFAVEVYDKMNGSNNKNGVYRVQMLLDSINVYDFIMHKISFGDSDYFNAHIDYYEWKNSSSFFTNLYKLELNPLPIFNTKRVQYEELFITPNKNRVVEIQVSDIEKNKSILRFEIERQIESLPAQPQSGNYHISAKREQWITMENWIYKVPKLAFLESQKINVSASKDTSFLKRTFKIGNENVALFKPIAIYNKDIDLDSIHWNKLCVIKCGSKETVNYGGVVKDSIFSSKISSLGTFQTHLDTIAPTIKNVNLSENMASKKNIRFIAKDELKAGRKNLKFTYNAWIDDEWVLLEYDEKKDHLTYYFDSSIEKGTHTFKIEVVDWAGNVASHTSSFVR